jgi:outer membrane protein OmpA-like peptidoglycan-associated protein
MILSKMPFALVFSGVLVLSACDTVNNPNNPNRNAQTAAMVGAGLGAVVGIARGDDAGERNRGAIVGALIGAGLGAGVGTLLDRQEAELRQQMGSNAQIVNTGSQLIVTLPQDILFDTGSSALTGGLRNDLNALAGSINRFPKSTINVVGHTDSDGTAPFNQDLSARRAQAVSSVLTQSGVSPTRILSIGRGEDAPIATNLNADGKRKNRRVEITITPNG